MMSTEKTNKIEMKRGAIGAGELLDFLQMHDKDFDPPLSSRTDLAAYVTKITTVGDAVTARIGNELVGVALMYCNDQVTRRAFFSMLCIAQHARGNMVGTRLMQEGIRFAQERGMLSIEVRTDAHRSDLIRFHQQFGFHVIDTFERFGGFVGVKMMLKSSFNTI